MYYFEYANKYKKSVLEIAKKEAKVLSLVSCANLKYIVGLRDSEV